MSIRKLNIGLYGVNGHQIHRYLADHPRARLVAVADFPADFSGPEIRRHDGLEALLADPEVELVSLCSPVRAKQAEDAILALQAGKHVYAEKPCALAERDLDEILRAAEHSGCCFHEMAGTALSQPAMALREVVQSGRLGEIVQIVAQKSYPYFEGRPQDELVDGGLIAQCAVHAARWVEHVAGRRIASISAIDTTLGNPVSRGDLRMAASLMMRLDNGGLASITANYLNPKGTGVWGYESLRIFGTAGLAEFTDGGQRTRLVIGEKDYGPLDVSAPSRSYFDLILNHVLDGTPMPFSPEEETSPTRWMIRATQQAARNRKGEF